MPFSSTHLHHRQHAITITFARNCSSSNCINDLNPKELQELVFYDEAVN